MANASAAFLEAVRYSMRKIRDAIGAAEIDPALLTLEAAWQGGCHVSAELWRRLRAVGFNGSLRVVTEWVARKRRNEAAVPSGRPRKLPSARVIGKMMTTDRDHLSANDARLIVLIEKAAPDLLTARDLVDQFHAMIRQGDADQLDAWIKTAKTSLLESLANGITTDRNAVHAALTKPWSNGQTEGQITKLKLVKRQMYGRAKLDLLRARVMAAA